MTDLLEFTVALARRAGTLIKTERDSNTLEHDYKYGKELVTNADLMADRLIVETIKECYPQSYIVSEESSPDSADIQNLKGLGWIIDPIDGTVNFAHGHNQSAVSIACVQDGTICLGVVFNPFTDELFAAQLGGGATLNGELIEVAKEAELRRAIIATGFPYKKDKLGPFVNRVAVVLQHCADIRRLGSAALDICWVACGRMDGYYESLSLWDHAAAQLIAMEAGAEFGHFSEVPEGVDPQFCSTDIVIANPALYPQLRELLASAPELK